MSSKKNERAGYYLIAVFVGPLLIAIAVSYTHLTLPTTAYV